MPQHKGCTPWNKGLTKETDETVLKYSLSQSKTMKKLYKEGKICQKWKKPMSKKGRENIGKAGRKFHKENPGTQSMENNGCWRGGWTVYRKIMFEVYKFKKICMKCKKNKNIDIHHKDKNKKK